MQTNIAVEDRPRPIAVAPDGRELWHAMMEGSDLPIVVWRLDPDGELRTVDVNAACQPYGMVDWRDAPGMTLQDAVIPEMSSYASSRIRQCIETGKPQSYERAVDFPTGRKCWATNLIPLMGADGTNYVIGIIRPLPPEIASDEERHRRLVEGLAITDPGIIYVYDGKARRVTFAGGQVEELLGLKPAQLEALPDPVFALVHPDDRVSLETTLEKIGCGDQPPQTFEVRLRHSRGHFRSLRFHSKVLEREDDGAWHLIGVASDITDREQLREEVAYLTNELAVVQLKERRLIAQELHDSAGQQLIAAKLALASALERCPELAENERVQRSLDDVRQCLDDADREIRVLSYVLHPPAFSNQGLATVLSNFAMGFGGRSGIRMDVSIDKRINQSQKALAIPLLRVCQEALTNVHRHAHASTVRVHLDIVEHRVELEIVDDGQGFVASPRAHNGAAGLGLTSMRDRIRGLGGELTISGESGTTVKAVIPIP